MNGKRTQKGRFMWACSVAAMVLCCSHAVLRCALCACSWALGVHCCVLLYYRYALVLWCALRCVLHFSAVRCAASCCAMCVLCSNEQLRCVGCRSAMLSRKVCCALVCPAVLCCAVRWSKRVIPNRKDLCGWPGERHHAGCTKYSKVIQFGWHFESILRTWTDLG